MAMSEARIAVLAEHKSPHTQHESKSEEGKSSPPHATLSRTSAVVTSLVAGACAGALAKTAIAPLDRTKINFQTSRTAYSARAALAFVSGCVRREGAGALWRGNSATMARIVPYAAIQFTAHDQCKRVLRVDTPATAKQHPIKHLIAGSMAGVISQSATYPLDLARARMAVTNAMEYATLRAVFSKVIKEEGFMTLYRGYTATVLGVIPYAGVSFYTYDTLKRKYVEYTGSCQGAFTNMLLGGCAGAVAQSASYPLDIVRRRLQTSRRRPRLRGMRDTVRYVYSTEGWRGFYKGLSMNWVKGPISVGISFATYDAIKSTLRDLALSLQS